MENNAETAPRRILVYQGSTLALIIEDRPGTLHSTAAPGPAGPPAHPFLHGSARDTLAEHELGMLLQEATDFDDYLRRLIAAGFDLRPGEGGGEDVDQPPRRIVDGAGNVIGARWGDVGGITTLQNRPVGPRSLPAITLYQDEAASALQRALAAGTLPEDKDGTLRLPAY